MEGFSEELTAMRSAHLGGSLGGCSFEADQRELARFNRKRVIPGLGEPMTRAEEVQQARAREIEFRLLDCDRRAIAPLLTQAPLHPNAFVSWFEGLIRTGPGQGDALFPWLAEQATLNEMGWFLHQEVAGEAGFDDLVALTQIKMPARAKLEMARNYWDEMGRGQAKGMHGPMLEKLVRHLDLSPDVDNVVPEALALGNVMMALAFDRRFAFQSVGALGVIELTAPGRAAFVTQGLKRLGVGVKERHYFALHSVLDVRHAEAWNAEVIAPLVREDPRRARCIAEGALLRLYGGKRCFDRYRRELGFPLR